MSFLQALRRPPIMSSLGIRCACRRGFAVESSSSSLPKIAKQSVPPLPSPTASTISASTPAAAPRSSCAPDTLLKGMNYLKGQPPVLALADETYPEWLWNTLNPRVYEDDGPGGKKERMERRTANRQAIKDRNFMQTQ